MWPCATWTRSFPWPGEVAMLTVKIPFDQAECSGDTQSEVRQDRVAGKLGKFDAQRSAFGTANGVAQAVFGRVPIKQELFGPFKLISGDFEMHARFLLRDKPEGLQPPLAVQFCCKARGPQAFLDRLGLRRAGKQSDRHPVHTDSFRPDDEKIK